MRTMIAATLAAVVWCGGAYDPAAGTNFGACPGSAGPATVQAGTGGGQGK